MPTIFQAKCGSCSFTSDVFPAEYGAVLVDEPRPEGGNSVLAGAVLYAPSGTVKFAAQADPRLVVLAHPLEGHILAQTGYTWTTLAWAGRYVRVRKVVCKTCGNLFDVRRLTSPSSFGCLVGLILGLAGGIWYGVWEGNFCSGFWAGYGILLGVMGTANSTAWVYTQLRFQARAREIDGPHCCPHCQSKSYVSVRRCRSVPCPQCGERTMRIHIAGIS